MKKSRLFIVSGLSMMLGLGVVGGLAANRAAKNVEKVEATIWRQNPTIYFVPSSNWGQDSATFKMNYYDNAAFKGAVVATDTGKTYDSRKVYSFTVSDGSWVSAVQFLRMNSDGSKEWNYSGTFDISDNYDSGINSLTMSSSFSTYNSWTPSDSGIDWVSLSSITTTYTVTKLAVEFVNGTPSSPADWGLGTDTVAEGDTYAVPTSVSKNMEHFVGWFTNTACTDEYTARAINANLTIYAKYIRLTDDSYIYYVSEGKSTFTTIHFWGDKQTEDPGIAISSFERHGVVHFNGMDQNIYKIPVPSNGSVSCAFHNGDWTTKTYDINVTPGSAYYLWLNSGETNYSWCSNLDAAKALDLIFKVEDARNAVTPSGDIKSYSICGIAPATAKALYEEYNGLSSYEFAKSMVDNSTTYTYDPADLSKQTDVSFYDVMDQLAKLAVSAGLTVTGYSSSRIGIFANTLEASNNAIIVIVASALTVTAVGGYFLLRRKKQK